MGLKGPQVMISTLTKHYFGASIGDDDPNKELLYRQAFTLFKVSIFETWRASQGTGLYAITAHW
jgi:hypothetical protein